MKRLFDVVDGDETQVRTRGRLLEAAGEVFAQKGFREATVREICDRAGANIAAVNYHFGDKERLYAAVLRYAHRCAEAGSWGSARGQTAEERLRGFVEGFLRGILNPGRSAWHGKLMAREMMEPTPLLDGLVEERIRPMARELESIVGELLGRSASQEEVRLCVVSVVGQCVHYHHGRPVITRLYPGIGYDEEGIRRLACHISRFSIAALRHWSSGEGTEALS